MKNIGDFAFSDCSGLTSVTIGNGVTDIGENAFLNCYDLASVTIGNSVKNVGKFAFYYCSSLNSVKISDVSVWCNIKFGNSWANPLYYAHHLSLNGEGIKDLVIPNSVTSIGEYMFSGYTGLTSVTIPTSVTSIEKYAFEGCSGLTSIIIPNSVTSIGYSAFQKCNSLRSITIPNSVTSIGGSAFSGCTNLNSVTVKMKTPVDIDSYTFPNRKNATLFVPSGCKAVYAAADYWKDFKEIIEVVEVTDISQMDYAIYAEPSSGRAGDDVSINVFLKNANAATSYGFELVLPQGLSIATTSDGGFDGAVTKSTRHNGHTLTTNKLADNTYKVGVASLSSKALTGNDGLVLIIKAHVADNMAVGDYPILIQNPLIVNTDGTKPAVQNTQSKITIEDYIKGDVDGDGVVDLADAVLVINHYVGKAVSKFVEKAADVDGDGVIDLADAVRIINFYVGKVQSLAPSINIDRLDPQ